MPEYALSLHIESSLSTTTTSKRKKTKRYKTRMTASVPKQNPNTRYVVKNTHQKTKSKQATTQQQKTLFIKTKT